jgi:hypothetical protein
MLFHSLIEILSFSLEIVNFSIQEHFSIFDLLLSYESRPRNCFLVPGVLPSGGTSELVLVGLLLFHRVLNFAVRFAIKDHLRPSVILFENRNDVFVMEVLCRTWVHKCSVLQAIVFEFSLILLRDIKSFQNFIIFELQRGLGSTVLDHTKHL